MITLSRAQTERFERDGFLFPVRVLEQDRAEELRTSFLKAHRAAAADPRIQEFLDYKANVAFRWVDKIVHAPALLEAVAALLGPDLLLWSCAILAKEPRSAGHFTWHQDATYWGLVPPHGLTAWLALGDVGPQNGGMSFVPGVNKLGQLPHANTFGADVLLPRGQEIVDLPDHDKAVQSTLSSGEVSFHHVFTPHASGPNNSDGVRVGCAMVFVPTSIRQETMRESATLVRGRDHYNHFDLEPRPKADLDDAAVMAHAVAMRKMATWKK